VAELADAMPSKGIGLRPVRVRIPPPALYETEPGPAAQLRPRPSQSRQYRTPYGPVVGPMGAGGGAGGGGAGGITGSGLFASKASTPPITAIADPMRTM
jgi:hypothetical protein